MGLGMYLGRGTRADLLLPCLGLGLMLTYYPVGNVGTTFLALCVSDGNGLLAARGAFFAASLAVLTLLSWRGPGKHLRRGILMRLSFAAMVASSFIPLLAGMLSLPSDIGALAFAVVLGAGNAGPFLAWQEGFLAAFRARGKVACVVAIALSSLVSALFVPLKQVVSFGGIAAAIVMAVLVVMAWICWAAAERGLLKLRTGTVLPSDAASSFRPTLRTGAIMAALGAFWALSYSLAAYMGYGGGFSNPAVVGTSIAGIVANLAIIVLCIRVLPTTRGQFGRVLRWTIVGSGIAWAFMAPMASVSPALGGFLCGSCYLFVILCVEMFLIELCDSGGAGVAPTCVACLAWMAVGGGASKVLFGLFTGHLGPALAFELVSAVGLISILLVVAFLPSAGSNAVDLIRAETQGQDDESFESRLTGAKRRVAGGVLNVRETEVMEYILEGKSRDDIAAALSLSPHTIKNYTTSLYLKLGVHSARELTSLVMNEAEREK